MGKILCIEDEFELREDIVEFLEEEGHQVFEAGDGKQGLEAILANEPDIVISDITMPVMDGYDLLRTLRREHPKYANMPFLFLSALADQTDVMNGMSLGADDYLTKPINYDMLKVKIDAELRRAKRIQDEINREHVKLYTALTKTTATPEKTEQADAPDAPKTPQASPAPSGTRPTLPPLKINLVGSESDEMMRIENQLQADGHLVNVFRSGRAYVRQQSLYPAHVTFLWTETLDLNCEIVANERESHKAIMVLVIPERSSEKSREVQGTDHTMLMPVTADELVENIHRWGCERRGQTRVAAE